MGTRCASLLVKNSGKNSSTSEISCLNTGDVSVKASVFEILSIPAGFVDTLGFSRQCDVVDNRGVCGVAWEETTCSTWGLRVTDLFPEGILFGVLAAVQVQLEICSFAGIESTNEFSFSSCVSAISMIVLSLLERI